LVLGVLATIGEFERDLIRSRMTDGRKRALANGVQFGRKKKLTHFQRQEALARLEAGETQSVIAKTYGVDRATIRRLQS
jgi:DNA invertase Pin-like site-specific DNA recombinase